MPFELQNSLFVPAVGVASVSGIGWRGSVVAVGLYTCMFCLTSSGCMGVCLVWLAGALHAQAASFIHCYVNTMW